MIDRRIAAEVLELTHLFPVTGLLGARQVGKTTFVKNLISQITSPCIYLDLEFPDDLAKLAEPSIYFSQNEDKTIIIDEIQRMPSLFPVLRAIIDRNRKTGRFILLGSASPDLIHGASESLAGRIAYIELSVLNYLEISSIQSMDYHWVVGGFPEVFISKNKQFRTLWYRNFIQTYIERDLPQLGLKVDSQLLRNFMVMLAHNNGGIWNASTIAKSLGVTSPTAQKYLRFLEKSFMLTVLPSFHINVKKRIVKAPKIYYRDTGILHDLLRITSLEDLQGHPILGNSWESYVVEQIKQLVQGKYDIYYYRTHKGTECDLLLVDGIEVKYGIEIKYTSAPKVTKGLLTAIEDLKIQKKFIVTPYSDDYLIKKEIRVCSLETFISKYLV